MVGTGRHVALKTRSSERGVEVRLLSGVFTMGKKIAQIVASMWIELVGTIAIPLIVGLWLLVKIKWGR